MGKHVWAASGVLASLAFLILLTGGRAWPTAAQSHPADAAVSHPFQAPAATSRSAGSLFIEEVSPSGGDATFRMRGADKDLYFGHDALWFILLGGPAATEARQAFSLDPQHGARLDPGGDAEPLVAVGGRYADAGAERGLAE